MKPIVFSCVEAMPWSAAEIARQILDLGNWTGFTGYGMLPGIKSAEFETRTEQIVGTRIRVTNTDGSRHVEEIVEWQPNRVRLDMSDFSPPLSRLAVGFEETWEFEPAPGSTRVVRTFKMMPKSRFARPLLWLISLFLRRAVTRHLRQMRESRPPLSNATP